MCSSIVHVHFLLQECAQQLAGLCAFVYKTALSALAKQTAGTHMENAYEQHDAFELPTLQSACCTAWTCHIGRYLKKTIARL
jgi:hypothetical protein